MPLLCGISSMLLQLWLGAMVLGTAGRHPLLGLTAMLGDLAVLLYTYSSPWPGYPHVTLPPMLQLAMSGVVCALTGAVYTRAALYMCHSSCGWDSVGRLLVAALCAVAVPAMASLVLHPSRTQMLWVLVTWGLRALTFHLLINPLTLRYAAALLLAYLAAVLAVAPFLASPI